MCYLYNLCNRNFSELHRKELLRRMVTKARMARYGMDGSPAKDNSLTKVAARQLLTDGLRLGFIHDPTSKDNKNQTFELNERRFSCKDLC